MSRSDRRRRTVSIGGGETRQTETVIAGIVIGAALLLGFFVVDSLADATPATEESTVTNETFTATFNNGENHAFYTVAEEGSEDEEGFQDNEQVFNTSQDEVQLTEGTDYEWFPANGTVKLLNTSANQDAGGDPNGSYAITYTFDTHMDGFEETLNRIGDGLLIGGVVIIVVFAAVILRVLRGL